MFCVRSVVSLVITGFFHMPNTDQVKLCRDEVRVPCGSSLGRSGWLRVGVPPPASSNLSKLHNQRNQEIPEGGFSFQGGESKEWHFLHSSNLFGLPIYGKYIYSSFIAKFLNISRRKALSKEHRLAYVKRRKWWGIVSKFSLNSQGTPPPITKCGPRFFFLNQNGP